MRKKEVSKFLPPCHHSPTVQRELLLVAFCTQFRMFQDTYKTLRNRYFTQHCASCSVLVLHGFVYVFSNFPEWIVEYINDLVPQVKAMQLVRAVGRIWTQDSGTLYKVFPIPHWVLIVCFVFLILWEAKCMIRMPHLFRPQQVKPCSPDTTPASQSGLPSQRGCRHWFLGCSDVLLICHTGMQTVHKHTCMAWQLC